MKRENEYNTKQRKLILDYLIENKNKYTKIEDIYLYFVNQEIKIGMTTIYRYIDNLIKQNKLRVENKDNTNYYQYIDDSCMNHFHLKCEKCGKLIHLDCDEIDELNKHIQKEHKFKVNRQTIIYGLCEDCSKKQ